MGKELSQKKKRDTPMPASSAGLLRFFEDETKGIKVRPEAVVISAVVLMVVSILFARFFPV